MVFGCRLCIAWSHASSTRTCIINHTVTESDRCLNTVKIYIELGFNPPPPGQPPPGPTEKNKNRFTCHNAPTHATTTQVLCAECDATKCCVWMVHVVAVLYYCAVMTGEVSNAVINL